METEIITITAIERTKKGRYALFADGEFAFSVTAEQLVQEKIQAGNGYTAEELSAVLRRSQEIFAKERALTLLSARSYTRKSLMDKLKAHVDREVAERAVDRMEELGLVNDRDYARRMASDCFRIKKYGRTRVIQALVQKGIDKQTAIEAADEVKPEENETVLDQLVARKHGRSLLAAEDRQDLYKKCGKAQNALVRMGYGFDEIRAAVDRFLEENEIYF